jgi:cytochrome c5
MKKTFLFFMMAVMFSILTSSVLSPVKSGDKKSSTAVTTTSIPDDLKAVFKNSCMDCHATGGKGMAMAKLNFSEWDNYAPDKQVKKAAAICNIITKGSMPPKSYGAKKPDAIPTASQKDMICKWSETLAPKK